MDVDDRWPWDARYAHGGWLYGTEPNDFIRSRASALPTPGDVVCLAGGQGRNGVFLAGLGHRVTVVDRSPVALMGARRLAAERGVEITTVQADLHHYDPGVEAWDGIVSVFAHVPAAARRSIHHRIPGALRPGGALLLEAYTPAQIDYGTGGPSDPLLMMTRGLLRAELPGLALEHAFEGERPVVEGTRHTGLAHVVQIVARRLPATV